MTLFHYEGLASQGKKCKGVIEASGRHEACDKLREQDVMVTKLSMKTHLFGDVSLRGENLLNFTIQLSQLVSAGVPLYESLVVLEEQHRGEKFHQIILSLCERVKGGSSVSEAMALYPKSFDSLYCAMVAAGESSGALDSMLSRLSELLSRQDKLKKQIVTAMIYPAVLSCFTLGVVLLLLMFVVPSIEAVFEGGKVNGYTQAVLVVSHFLSDYWLLYIPLTVGLVVLVVSRLHTLAGRSWLDRTLLTIPVVKNVVVQSALTRFARTMATLQQGGVTIIESLQLSRKVMKNKTLENIIKNAEEKIVEGSSLSAELRKSPLMPIMVTRMLSVGEDTGDIASMLMKVADIYETEVEKTLTRLTALAQPIILIVLGSIVGMVILAVLLPFMDITAIAPS